MLNYLFFTVFWRAHKIEKMDTFGCIFSALNVHMYIYLYLWITFVMLSEVLCHLKILENNYASKELGLILCFVFYVLNWLYYLYKKRYIKVIRNWRKYDNRKRLNVFVFGPLVLLFAMWIVTLIVTMDPD